MIRIRFRQNSFVARIAAFVLQKNNCAIVFNRTIHLYHISRHEILHNKELLCHELVHVMQWKKHGLILFPLLYLWYSMHYGYYQNPFEIEARAKEKDISILNKVRLPEK